MQSRNTFFVVMGNSGSMSFVVLDASQHSTWLRGLTNQAQLLADYRDGRPLLGQSWPASEVLPGL